MSENNSASKVEERQKLIGLWTAGILAVVGLAFFGISVYIGFVIQHGKLDSSDKLLLPVALAMFVINLIAFFLIQRGRYELGLWLIFSTILVPPVIAALMLFGFWVAAIAYLVALTLIMITWIFPKSLRRPVIILASLAVLIIVGIELWNPKFRITSSILSGWTLAITIFAAFGLLIFFIRQAWGGSLRTKLMTSFIGLIVLATGALSIYTVTTNNRTLTTSLESELETLAVDHATRVGDLFNEQINILNTLSINEVLQQAVEKANQEYEGLDAAAIQAVIDAKDAQWQTADAANNNADPLVREHITNDVALDLIEFQDLFPNNVEIFITDVHGGLAGTSNRTSDYYQADEEWWQAAYNNGEGSVYISDPIDDASTGVVSAQIALPIRGRKTGEIVGILRATYAVSSLKGILAGKSDTTQQADLYIPGETARIHEGSFEKVDPAVFNQLQQLANQGAAEIPFEGALSILTRAQVQTLEGNPYVDKLDWFVVFHQDRDEAFAPINAQLRGTIIIMALLIALAAAIAFLISQALVRPIINLTKTAQEIADGNIDTQAAVTSSDEVGLLASAFNTMTAQLRAFIATLEQRVADRTKALATSTDVSRRLSTILDRKQLVNEVVNQVNSAFGYYHTQIYFYDADNENLIMAGGTGEAGQMMLAQFHKVAKGRGLVGRAAESNQPILVSDTLNNSEWLPNLLLPETKSEVALPISIGDQVLGVLDVQHNITDGLQQKDIDSLQSITNQVAVALQNIRQYENTLKIASDMGVVATVGIATSTITDSQKLLQEVVDLSKRSFNLYHAHIYLMNEAGNELDLTAGAGEVGRQMVSEKRSIPLDSEQSLVARAARTREGVVVNDVTLAPDFLPNPLLPDTRSEMAVPMIVADKVIGVLDVQSETIGRFTDVDVSIKTTLASQVAVALQNARSFAQSQHQAQRETAVNLITQKIQSTTSIEAALQIAARELGRALGMKSTMVTLEPEPITGEGKVVINE